MDGFTTFHMAAAIGDKKTVERLYMESAHLNTKCVQGRAPFHKAAHTNKPKEKKLTCLVHRVKK